MRCREITVLAVVAKVGQVLLDELLAITMLLMPVAE